MAIFKCKMCGGTLQINSSETIAACQYCGTKQTLPRLDDERKANLYDRASHFRRNNEFDKAMGIYEQILNEDSTDAESYWSLVLCRYGIEYVEDPASKTRVPTVNRAQYTSVFDDEDYKSALKYADGFQKSLYEQEAAAINDIQKGILSISNKEEAFDIFICYKETDAGGRRTIDSVLATELYHGLTEEGFNVFFSRITLEDKLGQEYEPYIFAALNSAKVMVVLGTKPEHFNAAWVKNEWSRYLALIKSGKKKTLIPAYRDMDPYNLPEEFSHLQAQDMSKLGFMQDLIRGIKKIVKSDSEVMPIHKETIIANSNTNPAPLLKRVFIFLKDGNFSSANEYCEKVLDINPECAEAYLGKLMAELQIREPEGLKDCPLPFDNRSNYQNAFNFGDETLKNSLKGYIEHINVRNANKQFDALYNLAVEGMNLCVTKEQFLAAAEKFDAILEYKDSKMLAQKCRELSEVARKNAIYNEALLKTSSKKVSDHEAAIALLESISGWKDADEQRNICLSGIEELKIQEEKDRIEAEKRKKRKRKLFIIISSASVAFVAFIVFLNSFIIPSIRYDNAAELFKKNDLEGAYSIYSDLGSFKDSADKANEVRLLKNINTLKNCVAGDYVKFGTYEQDNKVSNGKEEIEWLVLEVKDNKAFVVSRYALDCQPYITTLSDVTWETSTIRKWLNEDFVDSAFFEKENSHIVTAVVPADKNPLYTTTVGATTQDKVFLLSITEMNKYFTSDAERICEATPYAVKRGVNIDYANKKCRWWLRTPGRNSDCATNVFNHGVIHVYGADVNNEDLAVRPAMWISIDAIE